MFQQEYARHTGILPLIVLLGAGALSVAFAPLASAQDSNAPQSDDPLAPWRTGVRLSQVSDLPEHSIHAYYVISPESPDGQSVLYYTSSAADAQTGQLVVRDRATGTSRVVASDLRCEDAHRVACQEWAAGGQQVVYHNVLEDGRWVVETVARDGSKRRRLAEGRQKGFNAGAGDQMPLYGPHWHPGKHRDLELVNVKTGQIQATPFTARRVADAYPEWIARQFGERPISIFFPVLSPTGDRVFFKIATPAGGDFRSKTASRRYGIVAGDLKQGSFTFMQEGWGHPAWSRDGQQVLNTRGRITQAATGKLQQIPNLPKLSGSHPSFSPDGRLFTSDAKGESFGGEPGTWVIGVGDVRTGEFVVLHKFLQSQGARSWRVNHPHPVFSPDGERIYYNVSADEYTRLHVAAMATDE